ncbi:endonuclease MutS2 [Miniphocaeibacter massiliensis]|uniref:endonuclease MutS2 n=1 Tax=Miniphocaeibacter massiliensis TaxID=2041841 RepID=UPI000C081490|nr:endonuclease MutS2 [Miniphocaeibacter massiliensis]
MNERALKVLEYNLIINRLVEYTKSNLGKDISRKLMPTTDIDIVKKTLEETEEACSLIYAFGNPSIYEINDFILPLKHVEKGGSLNPKELLDAATLLRSVREVKKYLGETEENNIKYPIIYNMIFNLIQFDNIESNISSSIISETEISDNASSELKRIRREIQNKTSAIRNKLNSILKSQNSEKLLQDSFVTIRDGRYVIPVKSENRSFVKGIVHDQSSSGATAFIEPMAVVELNNDIRILESKEAEEIKKILRNLSIELFEIKDQLIENQKILSYMDFVFAKGNLAIELEGTKPEVNTNGIINLKKARHPALDKKTVVPIDVYIGKDYNTLVITGPNTGGKTVTLKTVGLLTLMAQSGLMIPCNANSEIAIFNEIFADIGDEQSIEQSLSTFSSHMTNIVNILENLQYNSLVLFDELGAGTDPTEGAALAIAILERLLKKNIRTMATTHYSQLKLFALNTKGVKNGSVEFNVDTLRPTYKLTIGIPGKSNAFEISKRLGLGESIINEAKELISEENQSFEDVLSKIEYDRKQVEESKKKQEELENEIKEIKLKLQLELDKAKNTREKIIEEAREEAYNIILEAKDSTKDLIKHLKFLEKDAEKNIAKEVTLIEKDFSEKLKKNTSNKNLLETSNNSKKEISIGDDVEILGMNEIGEVITNPDKKGDIQVQVGIMKINANIKNLRLVESKDEKKASNNIKNIIKNKSSKEVNRELDLRGLNIEEAIYEIDKFIDDAYIVGLKEVVLIHGKGTGALRQGVQKYLNRNKHAKSFRIGSYSEGGTGVTVVEIK